MATHDLSRAVFDPRQNFRGVQGQAGRLVTDEDLGAIDEIAAHEMGADRLGIIGPHGTSNDGFRVFDASADADGMVDFSIDAGDYWVGGLRATLHQPQRFQLQSDWLQMEDVAAPDEVARTDLVVLEVWTQTVSGVEDEALLDPALGGNDTTARTRVMARVKLESGLNGEDCAELWASARANWEEDGLGVVSDEDHELEGDATLTVGFAEGDGEQPLCSPSVAHGFLCAANQAVRVQMVDPDQFTWGFGNGGQLYRALLHADRRTLELLTDPKDEAHWPGSGQIVEVLPWGAVLADGEKIAEELEPGHFSRVDTAFDPDEHTLTMVDEIPTDWFGFNWQDRDDADDLRTTRFGTQTLDEPYVFVRIWDRGEDRTSPALVPVGADAPLGDTGLVVNIDGDRRRAGDHWIIAARPHAPDEVAPWDLLVEKRYMGFRRYVAPLAYLIWDPQGLVHEIDCRALFSLLTRLRDCVTVRVGNGTDPDSHGDFTLIQDAVDALQRRPRGGKILVLPGEYEQRVHIDGCTGISISGCGGRTRIVAPDVLDEPVFTVTGSSGIEIRDLTITAPDQLAVSVERGEGASVSNDVHLADLDVLHFQRGGISFAAVSNGSIARCRLVCSGVYDPAVDLSQIVHRPAVILSGTQLSLTDSQLIGGNEAGLSLALGGVQIGGASEKIAVLRNDIAFCYNHGITLGSVHYVPADVAADSGALAQHYATVYGTTPSYYGFASTAVDCFGLNPNSRPEDPHTGEVLTPVSDGPIRVVRIEDNQIRNMGGCGVSVVVFFDLERDAELISVEDISILRNRIVGNLRGVNAPYAPRISAVAAWAAIALADVARGEIRENTLEGSGRAPPSPTCGIFALFAEELSIVENRIVNNGTRANESGENGAGWCGGIVIGHVRPTPLAPIGIDDDPEKARRTEGTPALRVHGNVVSAPRGRALSAIGLGPMQVTDNRLTTQSGGTYGWLVAAAGLQTQTLNLYALLLTMLVVAAIEDDRPNAMTGHALLAALGGEVVALGNSGVSSELYLQGFGLSTSLLEANEDTAFDYQGDLLTGGDIMLNDNQIRLDGMDARISASISAVALFSLDSVSAQDNQISMDINWFDFVAIDLMAVGWGVMIQGNRLKEPMFNTFVSILSAGLMNSTCCNQSTHCVLPIAAADLLLVKEGNIDLISAIVQSEDYCDRILSRAGRLKGALFG
jgi:hypothetical protein